MVQPARRKPARLLDVAKAAGVSVSTASRALTVPNLLSPATAAKVQEVAQKLGYAVQGIPRAASARRTRAIGAVFPDLDNAIFAITAHALQKKLAEHGYMLVLACSDYSKESELSITRTLLERGVDGIVLTGVDHHPALVPMLQKARVPLVFTWAFQSDNEITCIGFDNYKAGALIAGHMAQLGHRKIAVIAAYTAHTERYTERLRGIRETLEARGLELPDDLIVQSQLAFETGREGVRKLFAYGNPPTALICSNDIIATGAMAECHDRGLRVPHDVSITGFEDLSIASYVRPSLTTIRWSQNDLGRLAGEAIVAHISDPASLPTHVEIPVELIVRNTTMAPEGARRGDAQALTSVA
ncbi:MAG TPA: substrate-binding domain-containing protein [Terrimicrobiaceae bacterium]|nr:substrate-binding domain-containing protein [Terrimicrobiaceae bacterium]